MELGKLREEFGRKVGLENFDWRKVKEGKGTQSVKAKEWKEADGKTGKYTGEVKGEAREGRGVMEWSTGERYEGGWEKNKPEGYGRKYMSWFGKTSAFEGEFKEGEWRTGKYFEEGEGGKPVVSEYRTGVRSG